MNKIKIILVIIFLAALWVLLPSFTTGFKTIDTHGCRIQNLAFIGGEQLVYKIYYNVGFVWIPAGEVVFEVDEKPTTYELKVIGKTYKSYDNIFKVNDYFHSSVNKETLFPNVFVRVIEEGDHRIFDSIAFDQNKNVAVSFHGSTRENSTSKVHRLDQCMQDIVSNMYYMRNINTDGMKKGDLLTVKMLFDKEIYPIQIRYKGKEKKEIKNQGIFKTIKIHPDIISGNVFKDGDKMTVWISDDHNKVPLMIESPVSIGSIKAVLKSHKGLKYTLESEIKN